MEVTYNNKKYIFDLLSSTENLIKREELLLLPLDFWRNLLLDKNGYCDVSDLKKVLIAKIQDTENKAKYFKFDTKLYWLDKTTRTSIKGLLTSGILSFNLVLPDCIVKLTELNALLFINNLEIYSYECFINTLKHLRFASSLKTIGDIINYDYTKGYPDKLVLNGEKLQNN